VKTVAVVVLIILGVIFAIFMQVNVGNPPSFDQASASAKEEGLLAQVQLACGLGILPIVGFGTVMLFVVGRVFFVEDEMKRRHTVIGGGDFPAEHANELLGAPIRFGWNKELVSCLLLGVVGFAIYLFVTA